MKDRHLISVDELRAAGALDVPPAWRKSLGNLEVERQQLSLFGDDVTADTQPAARADAEGTDEEEDSDDEDADDLPA